MIEDPDVTLPPAPWRRPLLVFAGLSLLAVGAFANADDLGLSSAPSEVEQLELEELEASTRLTRLAVKGETGMMGKPASKQRSGLYAMKGPKGATPAMQRAPSPEVAARNAGILGQLSQDSGHFLASPYGLGAGHGPASALGETYGDAGHNAWIATSTDAKSTFSIDVDTAAYSNMRRYLVQEGMAPPPAAVRTEELVNYFDYDYPQPEGGAPFSVVTEVGPAPWNAERRIVHVGLQGLELDPGEVPPRNLVFLVDVSGSMAEQLPIVKSGLMALAQQLRAEDRISIVVYAGAAGAVLEPTAGDDKVRIRAALSNLHSGGGTNGAAGIHLAYGLAREHFVKGGINRVVLATDGDFNVGISNHDQLVELIEAKRESGVFLSVLGFGYGNVNDHMMEQIADKGNGNYAFIDGEREAHKVLVAEGGATLDAIAKDVKVQVEFDPAHVRSHRLIGYENRVLAHRDFDDDTKDAGEIGSGHTVTALYEIDPVARPPAGPMMTLDLRYKLPDQTRSTKVSFAVSDDGLTLADTSTDYRFAAAVAAMGRKLHETPVHKETSYTEIYELAQGALGDDPYCHRHEFLELVRAAAGVHGEAIADTVPSCVEHVPPPPPGSGKARPAAAAAPADDEDIDWAAFALSVLRLLPPLLAFPLFVLAFRRRR